MKHWEIQFSMKYKTGRVKEGQVILEAENITIALAEAWRDVCEPMLKGPDTEIADVVIWYAGIVEEDVF